MVKGTPVAGIAFVMSALTLSASVGADDSVYPRLQGDGLERGREVWLGTCRNCHATGFADAPAVKDYPRWVPRLAQGRATLYGHALNGFYGADYAHMPPRGGNSELSDREVRLAVDYMVGLVDYFNKDAQHDTPTD